MDIFQHDSKFMSALGVMANLMMLNFLTLLLCLPLITAGASLTAMHYVLLKIVKDEEGNIPDQFFRAFKLNFRQATIIWIGMLIVYAAMFVDWRIMRMQGDQFAGIIVILLYGAIAAIYLISLYVFPVLSRYRNTIGGTIKTAFAMAAYGLTGFRTIICGLINLAPLAMLYLAGYAVVPVFLAFCFTGPGYFRAKIYSNLFNHYEGTDEIKEIDETDNSQEDNE